MAFSQVMEQLKNIEITTKAKLIRKMALEMERCAVHIGDLGAIAGDIAYLMGAAVFGATRTLIINTMLEFSGSRFGRGLITIGGVNFDIEKSKIEKAKKTLSKVEKDIRRMVKTMINNSSVMSRLEKTGTVNYEKAQEIGLTGLVARASGINIDSRYNFQDELWKKLDIHKKNYKYTGDVFSRFMVRYHEILESIEIINKIFKQIENNSDDLMVKINEGYERNAFSISIAESWRGEVIHIGITDFDGNLCRYKIKDSSFNNWYGLALAVRNNGISDFPLCNKSFNLSYTGNDL
jgi:Ni,Fe-hydrogenase III large subunit